MRFISVVMALACGSILTVPAIGQNKDPSATVHLKVVDRLGEDIDAAEVTLFQSEFGGGDFANRFRRGSAHHIPFGHYYLRVHAVGFESGYRDVAVLESNVWVLMGLGAGNIGDPGAPKVVSGSIRRLPHADSDVWVRLAGVAPSVLMDAKADKSGGFELTGVPDGQYVLMVSQANKVLDIRRLAVAGASVKVMIDLPSGE